MIDGRGRRLALCLAVLLAMLGAAPRAAFAAPSDEEAKSRKFFEQAESLANDGRWKEACLLFQASHDLHATGGTALRTADCYEKINDYDHAIGMYQYIVDHRATDKRADRVTIAEQRLAALTALRNAQKAQQTQQVQAPPPPKLPPPPKPNRVPAIVAFAVGGAGAVVGGVFGGLALAQASDVRTKCMTAPCHAQPATSEVAGLRNDYNAAKVKATVSDVGLGIAVVGVVTGVTLWALGVPKAAAAVNSAVGPNGITVRF